MRQKRKSRVSDYRSDYATNADFCNALVDSTDLLYRLAFLLMINHVDAENCFVAMVEETFRPNTIFKEWVVSWLRRTLIMCAIKNTDFNTSGRDERNTDLRDADQGETGAAIDAITHLANLKRFVFVMTVLEGYSVYECSLLLGCPSAVIIKSRAHALRDISARLQFGERTLLYYAEA